MPLANYRVAPFVSKRPQGNHPKNTGDFFNLRDRRAIQSGPIIKKIEQVLEKTTHHKFNIIMLEYNISGWLDRKKPIPKRYHYIEQVKAYCEANNIPLQDHITFAKNSSTGDPLSPWMILHTIGHALLDQTRAELNIKEIFNAIYAEYKNNAGTAILFLSQIFKFASAKALASNKEVSVLTRLNIDELVYELVAEYLWHGFIRFDKSYPGIENYVSRIEEIIQKKLDESVGKIVVDFFLDE